jgi:hypothetical protein
MRNYKNLCPLLCALGSLAAVPASQSQTRPLHPSVSVAHVLNKPKTEFSAKMSLPLNSAADQTIIVASSWGSLFKVNPKDGRVVWSWKAKRPTRDSDLPAEVRFQETKEVKELRGDQLTDAQIENIVLASNGLVLASTQNKMIYAVENGRTEWILDLRRITGLSKFDIFDIKRGAAGINYALGYEIAGIDSPFANGGSREQGRVYSGTFQKRASLLIAFNDRGKILDSHQRPNNVISFEVDKRNPRQVYFTESTSSGSRVMRLSNGQATEVYSEAGNECFKPFKLTSLDNGNLVVGNNHQNCGCSTREDSVFLLGTSLQRGPSAKAQVLGTARVGCVEGAFKQSGEHLFFNTLLEDDSALECPKSGPNSKACHGKLHVYSLRNFKPLAAPMPLEGGSDAAPDVGPSQAPGSLMIYSGTNYGYLQVFSLNLARRTLTQQHRLLTTSAFGMSYGDELDKHALLLGSRVFVTNFGGSCGSFNRATAISNPHFQNKPCRLYGYDINSLGGLPQR